MKYVLMLLIGLSLVSCNSDNDGPKPFNLGYKGALKNMMHKGDIAAKANLSDFDTIKHLYALGAIENLKGEIQIFDGQPFNTQLIDSTLVFDQSFHKKATLLVYAQVSKWKSINVPTNVETHEQLEDFITKAAKENEIDINQPFPFLLSGTPQSFDWHVINWKDGDTEHSHEKHIHSGLHGTIKNRAVDMLGFYSDAHHAIFTHHTTNMHIHVKTVDNEIAGHVDDLTLGNGMILKLPE